jgi:hypothetical protein
MKIAQPSIRCEQDRGSTATTATRAKVGGTPRSGRTVRRIGAALAGVGAALAVSVVWTVAGAAPAHAESMAAWHILVYAVNDVSDDLPLGDDLDEMVAASRTGVSFTVFADNSEASEYDSMFVATTSDATIIEIAHGTATVTDTLGELDGGSPDTLGWFVATALQRHPSQRSALVVWGHGNGWQGIAYDGDRTALGESRERSSIDAEELGRALEVGLAASGRGELDLLMLDACLMANLEVMSETAGAARYLIASEESVSGVGLDYDAFSVFATEPKADAVRIFDVLGAGFRSDVERGAPYDSDMITLSLTDLSNVPALEQAVATFSHAAAADVIVNPASYQAAATAGFRYGVTNGDWAGYLDLGEYLRSLGAVSPAVASTRDALLAALDAAILAHIGSASYGNATGITVYVPTQPDANYDRQPTAQLWRPFLAALQLTRVKRIS